MYVLADDMLIAAENDEEHDKFLYRVLQTAQEEGVKFKKTQLKQKEVMYTGMHIGEDGLKPE